MSRKNARAAKSTNSQNQSPPPPQSGPSLSSIGSETGPSELPIVVIPDALDPSPDAGGFQTEAEAAAAAAGEMQSDVMTSEEFYVFFCAGLVGGGIGLGMFFPPAPWESLTTAASAPECRPSTDALYRLALRHDFLRFLILRDTQWFQDILIVGAFGGKIGMGVYADGIGRGVFPRPRWMREAAAAQAAETVDAQ